MKINLTNTIKGSMLEGFYPKGWDLDKIRECCSFPADTVCDRQDFWNKEFEPVPCESYQDVNVMLGHEAAYLIKQARDRGEKLAFIVPVGPVGQYPWMVYFLQQWNVCCDHVTFFNMDEWSDEEGNTPDPTENGSFKKAMLDVFYHPLGKLTVPEEQRNFASKENLPLYPEKIKNLKEQGAKLVIMYGIGRAFHVAFWEPHFAADYQSEQEWKMATHRIGAKLHPISIEQNAVIAFRSDYTSVPCFGNTIGPGLMFQSDYCIGGCSSIFDRGASFQGVPLWVTLRHRPSMWITSSYMPTFPGKLFFVKQMADLSY